MSPVAYHISCCVTGDCLAQFPCGRWLSSSGVSVWSVSLVAYHILLPCDWIQPRTILLWYGDILSCFPCLISNPRSISYFLLLCDWTQLRTILMWYVVVTFCCSCLIRVTRSISFFYFVFVCDWPASHVLTVVCGCPLLLYLSDQDFP